MISGVFPVANWGSGQVTPPAVAVTDHGYSTSTAVVVTDIPAHNTIVVTVGIAGGLTGVTVTDSSANVYTNLVRNSGSEASEIWYCLDPVHVVAGSTVTITWSAPSTALYIHVWSLNFIATVDQSGGNNGVSSSPSATTTGSVSASAVVFGNMICGPTGFTPGQAGGWSGTVIGFVGAFPGGNQQAADGYRLTGVAGVQTYAPTVSNLVVWAATIGSFKQ